MSKINTATKYVSAAMLVFLHCKKFRRIYGRIAGNQLPGYIPLSFTGTRKNYLAWEDRKEQDGVTYGRVAI